MFITPFYYNFFLGPGEMVEFYVSVEYWMIYRLMQQISFKMSLLAENSGNSEI